MKPHRHRWIARWSNRSRDFVVQLCTEKRPADERDRAVYDASYLASRGDMLTCYESRVVFTKTGWSVRGSWPERLPPEQIDRIVRALP